MAHRPKDEGIVDYKRMIGKRFEQLRNDLNFTQDEMAAALGFSQNMVFRLENDMLCSLDSMLVALVYFIRNHKVNPEWVFALDNQYIARYNSDTLFRRRKKEADDQAAHDIVSEMLKQLKKNKLI